MRSYSPLGYLPSKHFQRLRVANQLERINSLPDQQASRIACNFHKDVFIERVLRVVQHVHHSQVAGRPILSASRIAESLALKGLSYQGLYAGSFSQRKALGDRSPSAPHSKHPCCTPHESNPRTVLAFGNWSGVNYRSLLQPAYISCHTFLGSNAHAFRNCRHSSWTGLASSLHDHRGRTSVKSFNSRLRHELLNTELSSSVEEA